MQRSIISNEKVSYLYLGVLPENSWMSFLHCTSHYSLRKSLKDLSDHLNFFVSCQGRSQLSPAVFTASRNLLKPLKHHIYLKISKKRPSLVFILHQPYFWPHIDCILNMLNLQFFPNQLERTSLTKQLFVCPLGFCF